MKYQNASHVLPDRLLKEVQKYAGGETIYIPKVMEKKAWGEGSGARQFYEERNEKMRAAHHKGASVESLADQFGLSMERVKRIVYRKEA